MGRHLPVVTLGDFSTWQDGMLDRMAEDGQAQTLTLM
jgi:hypothetical protein